jgi:drug/metabolite transporter (DMT)-like permease
MIELLLLGAIWGGSFLFMRISAGAFGTFPLVEVRLALGAAVLLPFLWQARAHYTPRLWLELAGIGAINTAIPFALFAWAAGHAPAGIGAITNSLAVLFAALVARAFYREPIGPLRLLGLGLGFAGVVVLANPRSEGAVVWPAALAGTTAALLYGIGANLMRRVVGSVPAAALAASTLLTSALLLLPFALATWPAAPIPPLAWGSAVLLGAVCSGLAFVLYYRLLGRLGAVRAAAVTYLIPLFGLLWAWLFLAEVPTPSMLLAALLILGGVGLSQLERRSPAGK